ncbi:hypothetical protein OOZ19_13320 [Saccharopolyspora sp. NFXS83]|uniref:hypothetical protein n=1 Tax=Saccharopolyspora sp. NFXS83 TaxID=2993560 RepID=UPI00224AC3C1|nr:hypothetical protein [Saccharopolyspora sp. NFXS83]MCX2731225.1 hypothetical protein [Saccharopolyspora sp. NFXS83]
MTWQDELHNLDAELAAGRISAEEYRSRRDALIGRSQSAQGGPASGDFPQQQPGTPSGGFPQQGTPQSGQQNPSPFPPAFNWGAAAAQGAQAAQQQPQPSNESTQVVQNPLAQQSESTQVVNVGQQQPQQWGQQQQPQWNQQPSWNTGENAGSPWGDPDQPPAPEHGDTSWMRQGPEVFEVGEGSSKGKTIAGISLGAVLLVGVIVAGVFYFTSGDDEAAPPQPTEQQAPPVPTPEPLPEPPAAKPAPVATPEVLVAPPPGQPHPYNGPLDRPALENSPKAGVLREPVRNAALQGGLLDGFFSRSDGAATSVLLTVRMPDPTAAQAVAQAYLDDQQGLSVNEDLSYQGVEVMTTGGGVYRTAYVAHGWAVIVDVSAPDKAAAEAAFTQLLDQQLAQTPPTVRD